MTATLPDTSAPARPVAAGRGVLTTLFARSAYVLTGFPPAAVAFGLLVTGVAVAAGTLVIVVGVAVAAATLAVAAGFARLERARLDAVTGTRLPRPAYQPLRPGFRGGVLSAGADPRRWLDPLHGIVAFPVATVTFSIVASWWAAAVGGVGYVLWEWTLPHGDVRGVADLIGLGDGRGADIAVTTGLGLVALLTLPLVVAGCAAVQTGLGRALLGAWDD